MLDDPGLDVETKLAVLDRLKSLSKARSEALERERKEQDEADDEEAARVDAEAAREEALKYKLASEAAKRRRKALQEVFEWKQRFTKLTHQSQVLDRERQAGLRLARGHLEEETADLVKEEVGLDRKRDSDRRDLFNQLDKAKWAVERLANTVAEMGTGDAYLRAVEQQMDHAETCINAVKTSRRTVFEKLVAKEEALTQELAHLSTRFDLEEEQDRASKRLAAEEKTRDRQANAVRSPLASARSQSSRRSPRVEHADLKARIDAIEEEIAEMGGSSGHWDGRDHADFLRCVSRLKVADASLIQFARSKGAEVPKPIGRLFEKAGSEIPGKDEDAIQEHTRWNATGAEGKGKASAQIVAERKQREKELEQERKERRRAVAEWKAARDAERRAEHAAKEAEERAERERRAEDLQRRRAEKERIALFKLQREAERDRQRNFEAAAVRDAREHELRKATVSLKERQARDLALATQRRTVAKHKQETEKQDRATHIQTLKVRPAVRPGFDQKLKARSALTEATTAYNRKRLTPEELGELQERRARTRAHDAAVPSSAAASLGGRSYAIGVRNLVGGRAGASWRASS
ncbi:Hypothetical Protein FCC1311_108492 [Hondaea fermentalgiana]|uniref:Uncharacterized protein n=1 Tax=Hondaea fermentalgiana TaxID=2315210 RepID=A0A2R5GUU9_9STRA|nr:Hypothetical Protein FCC1311_108492 [Hondaea fermentalgiana]|eukprot:GBG34627.1 Hypothetical Protein FCC1311_108492 [Hondaea fermentalgiana]